MATYALHYAGAEFFVEGSSAIEVLENMDQQGIVSVPTDRGQVALVCGPGIPIWATERRTGSVPRRIN